MPVPGSLAAKGCRAARALWFRRGGRWPAAAFRAVPPQGEVQESLQASVTSLHASEAQQSVGGRSPPFQNISPVSRVRSAPDTSELARTLPQKYRRKLMSDEEIEYIQRGGPE
ncbi:alpha-ketoglutarate dehydrogenase component 4 isoform X1 [Opisthocomus hoazin]|uniref:alpha-ketoglutarate dehydrogenase component 4 isoform X1 n=1 Tax=Opisthocomus hoazin TaxID=30419 RepID=UPI003F53E10A